MDFLIGAIDYHDWADVCCWHRSALRSGFKGKAVLICYEHMTDKALQRIRDNGIPIVSAVSRRGVNEDRFRDIATFAETLAPTDRILMTDVRDVAFQRPIHEVLDTLLAERQLACASEGEAYGDSPWNLDNIKANFPDRVEELSKMEVFCAGVLAGKAHAFAAFARAIWNESIAAKSFNGDQIAMNIVIRSDKFSSQTAQFAAGNPHICHFGNLSGPDKARHRAHLTLEKGILSDLQTAKPVGVFHQYTRDKSTRNAVLMANGAMRGFYPEALNVGSTRCRALSELDALLEIMSRLAVTGFVSESAGSVASANAILLRQLLDTGHEIDFFSKPSFVDPRPAVGEHAGFRFVPVINRRSDGFRRRVRRIPVLRGIAERNDSCTYNRMLVSRIRQEHRQRKYDLVLWMGDYAACAVQGLPNVSFAQGPPGTDARSLITRRREIKSLAGSWKALRWATLARLRLSPVGLPKMQNSDHIIVGSKQSATTMTRVYGVPKDHVSVLPYPIDLSLFQPAACRAEDGCLKVLWLGRVVPRKRLDLFLTAAAKAIEIGLDLQLTIVGGIGFVAGYERMIEAFPHPTRLRWIKSLAREEVPGLMHDHDVLVQPSDEENFGSSVAEAQACGLPVIIGQTNGNADYLCPRDVHLADDSPSTLASAFSDMAERKRSGRWGNPMESRALAERHFALDHVTRLLDETLQDVMARQASNS